MMGGATTYQFITYKKCLSYIDKKEPAYTNLLYICA
jgi:hypothetical protein